MTRLLASIAMAIATPVAMAQCVGADGTSLNQNGVLFDAWTAAVPIGFAFPFNGTTYTDMYLSDHTLCALNNAGVPAAPGGGGFVWTPTVTNLGAAGGPMIAPYWSDHVLNATGEIYVENTPTTCTVSWVDVQTYAAGTTFSVAMTLHITGQIDFIYDNRVNNDGSSFGALNAIVGIGDVGAALATPSDLSSGLALTPTIDIFEEFITSAVGVPNPLFDVGNMTLSFLPTTPGWVCVTSSQSPCASMTTYGTGCGTTNPVGDARYELFTAFDLNNTSHTYLWTGNGYVLSDTASPIAPAIGTPTVFGDDTTQQIALGFTMPTPAGLTSNIWLCSNGWLSFAPTTLTDYTESVPELLSGTALLAFLWDDLNPGAGGSITIDQVGTDCIITFLDVPEFGTTNANTVQVVLSASGDIEVRYGTNSLLDCLVGVSPGNTANDGGAVDYSALGTGGPIVITTGVAPFGTVLLTLGGSTPTLGGSWSLTTSNIDPISPIAITFLSDTQVFPGLPLTAIGLPAPGCDIYIGNNLGSLTGISAGGSATVSLPIPNAPAIAGATLFAQSICLTLQNPFNILTSNGGFGTVGY